MNNREILFYFAKYVECGGGYKLTSKQKALCVRALERFKRGCVNIVDCYKKPSFRKISAYLECEALHIDKNVKQIYSSVVSYNSQFFSWAGLWVDSSPNEMGYINIYLRYDTPFNSHLIDVGCIPYVWVK